MKPIGEWRKNLTNCIRKDCSGKEYLNDTVIRIGCDNVWSNYIIKCFQNQQVNVRNDYGAGKFGILYGERSLWNCTCLRFSLCSCR